MAKTTKQIETVKTEKTVETINILDDELTAATEAQKNNSIYLELGEKPTLAAVVGCAMWTRPFTDKVTGRSFADLILGLKVIPHSDPENPKIITIRAFKKLDQKSGKMAASSFAYRQAADVCKKGGAVIKEVGGPDTKPNFKDFSWVPITATVVTIGSRLWEGRHYPNSVHVYVPPAAPTSGNFLDEDEVEVI